MISAKEAKATTASVKKDREEASRRAETAAYNKSVQWGKKVVPEYLEELEQAIKVATTEGRTGVDIRLPGYQDDQGTRVLAWCLSETLREQGYTTSCNYHRSHDIEYQDDHWTFSVSWD